MKRFYAFAAASLGAALLAGCGGRAFVSTPPIAATSYSASDDDVYAAVVKTTPDFRDLGRAPGSTKVQLSVMLRYQNENQLEALVQAQSDRGSPYFRHYLSNAEFNASFAPPARAQSQVVGVLERAGLRVVRTYKNRTIVEAVGPSAAVERLFATRIDYGIQAGNGPRYKNVTDAVMPASLRGLVVAVMGLDDLVAFAPHTQIVPRGDFPAMARSRLRGPNDELGPLGFQRAYDEPAVHGYDGTGRAIGVTMSGDINDVDLDAFLDYFQIKPAHRLHRIAVDGGRFGRGDIETTVDIEAEVGTAPGAAVYLYSFPDFKETSALDTYNAVVDDNLVDAANSSWGGCESFKKGRLGHAFARAANLIFEQGSAKGITFPIATGDFGSASCLHDRTLDITTADDAPHALAIGGTTLHVKADGSWESEVGWHGSGGGISTVFAVPYYQREVHHILAGGRNIPDISLSANPHSGFAGRWHAIWVGAGGTSLGGPLWSGLEAQIDQYVGGRIGFVNPEFYQLELGPSYHTVFHDEIKGNNRSFICQRGYDLVTGIGSPIGWALAQALK
ncbi:MAG TPA: S53 family peptidase [Candidatus Cybelea sp.]